MKTHHACQLDFVTEHSAFFWRRDANVYTPPICTISDNCFGQLLLNLKVTQFLESCLDKAAPSLPPPTLNNVVGFVYNIL